MKKLVPIPPESLKRLKKDDLKDFGYQFVSVRLKDGRVFAQAVASEGCLIQVCAKANLEIKVIAELLARKQEILQKLHELRKSDGSQEEQFKTDVAVWIADVEKSVKRTESKPKAT